MQDQPAGDLGQVAAEAEVRDKAEWAVPLRQDRAEIVYAQAVEKKLPTLSGSPAIKETVPNVVLKW